MNTTPQTNSHLPPTFSELFDLDEIQTLQDAFSTATGVASIITAPDGTPLTRPSGFCTLCQDIIRKTEAGLRNCKNSDAVLGSPYANGPRIQPCKSGGLLDGGASILVDGNHVANWLVGQVLTEDVSEEQVLSYAHRIGADPAAFKQALDQVPRMSRRRFHEICEFLHVNARLLSHYAHQNRALTLEVQRRVEAEAELIDANTRLEARVSERTLALEELTCELEEMNTVLEEEIHERECTERQLQALNTELEARVRLRTALLEEREQLYNATFRQSPSAIELYDAQGNLINANDACLALAGVSDLSDLQGLTLFSNPNLTPQIRKRIRNQETVHFESTFDYAKAPYCSRHQSERHLDWRVAPLMSGSSVSGYIVQIMDVTEQKRAHLEILRAKEEAEAASLSKSQFLANMSHEIRTPMNGIIGYTELALMSPLNDEQRDYLNTVKNATHSLLRVVNDILDYSKIEAGAITLHQHPFRIREVIQEVVDLFAISARHKNLSVQVMLDPGLPQVLVGDAIRLKQILSNLVGNAVKFTPCGGVTIDVSSRPSHANETEISFSIRDTGIGIPEDKIPMLFQSFYQVDSSNSRAYGGTGLGLVISRNLVEMMGGSISVQSMPEAGSTFHFSVVVPTGYDIESETRLVSVPLSLPAATPGKKVLLAEDDLVSQQLGKTLLERRGFQVEIAGNGQEAVDKALDDAYDIILMDLNMPHLDGLSATKMIRRHQQHVPIIALTAQAISGDREKCLDSGMDDYLSKPLQFSELQRILDQYT